MNFTSNYILLLKLNRSSVHFLLSVCILCVLKSRSLFVMWFIVKHVFKKKSKQFIYFPCNGDEIPNLNPNHILTFNFQIIYSQTKKRYNFTSYVQIPYMYLCTIRTTHIIWKYLYMILCSHISILFRDKCIIIMQFSKKQKRMKLLRVPCCCIGCCINNVKKRNWPTDT